MGKKPVCRTIDVAYRRDSQFSYACHACNRCCHDKVIQLNPYEVARLAQNRGISTTELLARYTERKGTALRRVEEGACVFLTPQGCGVHPDRPLVCRLYPLGRKVRGDGAETFHEVAPHPQTEGEYGTQGTVQDFLLRQGVGPFIEAVDRYVDVVGRMTVALANTVQDDERIHHDVQQVAEKVFSGADDTMLEWIDMDRVVERHCARQGIPIPASVDAKMVVHIQALDEWARVL